MSEKYLGYVTDKIASRDESKGTNAILEVVAIKESGKFRKLSSEEAKQLCPPNGQVFGPQFFSSFNSDFCESTFIEFEILQRQELDRMALNQTDCIVNYKLRPKAINLPRLIDYNGRINSIVERGYLSPNDFNFTIDKKTAFGSKSSKFFLYDSSGQKCIGIFKYQNKSDVVESNYGKEVKEFKIPNMDVVTDKDGKKYLLFNEQQNELEMGKVIDFMTDSQLAEWLKTKMRNMTDIDRNTLSRICNFPEFMSAADNIEVSRFKRLNSKVDALKANVQYLFALICTYPEYCPSDIKLIEQQVRENFEKKCSEEEKVKRKNIQVLQDEICKLENNLKSEKEKLQREAQSVKAKLEEDNAILSKQVEEKERSLNFIKENYDSVIANISAIVPVLNNSSNKITDNEGLFEINRKEFPKALEARPYSKIKEENEEPFVSFMKRNVCCDNERLTEYLKQVKKVFSHKACFIPNTAIAYLYAKALRNTDVMVMHVEHDWLHYSDFTKHGLLDVVKEASQNTGKNYILLLDGINITQPECGLRPLLNLINGDVPTLEGCGLPFPSNMTIMATVLSSTEEHAVGLKLTPSYFRNWFAVGNPKNEDDKIPLPENFWDVTENNGYTEPAYLPKENVKEKAELLDSYLNF